MQRLTKLVAESALDGEMDDHLGSLRRPAGRDGGNSRNGRRTKTLLTEAGPVDVDVPRDRDESFEPRIVAKRQRRLSGVDDLMISLSANGLKPRGDQCKIHGSGRPSTVMDYADAPMRQIFRSGPQYPAERGRGWECGGRSWPHRFAGYPPGRRL